ncbi:hypothetical protein [Streptomyces sp. NPDC004658]|uniref:hypothetical protein n=1 Tax=Streptomyces sp. NPDC004658 TaxID=3154672 RepID=UPI00339DE929
MHSHIFTTAHHALSEADGWLRLAAIGEPVMRTLTILGVNAVLDCRETLHQALTSSCCCQVTAVTASARSAVGHGVKRCPVRRVTVGPNYGHDSPSNGT